MNFYRNETKNIIEKFNQPGIFSVIIQDSLRGFADKLGFRNEAKGLFANYDNKMLRTDYFLKLSEKNSILLKVERDKTIINNMGRF